MKTNIRPQVYKGETLLETNQWEKVYLSSTFLHSSRCLVRLKGLFTGASIIRVCQQPNPPPLCMVVLLTDALFVGHVRHQNGGCMKSQMLPCCPSQH